MNREVHTMADERNIHITDNVSPEEQSVQETTPETTVSAVVPETPAAEASISEADVPAAVISDIESTLPPKKASAKKKSHLVRNIIIAVIAAMIVGLLIWGGVKFFGSSGNDGEVMNAMVDTGSITSTVSGEGLTRAKESANLTLTTSGTVQDVYVKEGDKVEAGQQLYRITSESAENAVTSAQKDVESCMKELKKLEEAQANLTMRAPHGGKLLDVAAPTVGNDISSGTTVAKLADDSKLILKQYYSYAYASDINVGQSAEISIPSLMSTVKGKVSEIAMVERISPEGSKLFEVSFVLDNPGTLTADMLASATLTKGSEILYPYETGKLQYSKVTDLVTKVGGSVQKVNLRDYGKVKSGEVLLVMGGDENDSAIFNTTNQLKNAQKTLEEAQKALNLLNGTAPIAGTVMSISINPGDEVNAGTTVAVVSDTSAIVMDAKVDERNISFVKEGMPVEIDQWGNMTTGTVLSVSLTSTAENGIATFPAIISIDNPDGTIMPGSYASYTIVASQSNDCMILPIQAVKSVETADGTKSVVFIHTDTRPENAIDLEIPVDGVPEKGYFAVPVTTGISDNQNIEILDGVEPGTEVFQQVMYNEMY